MLGDDAPAMTPVLLATLIGLFVESVIFRTIEAHTVNLWGMQR
jgi:hypothetical protein